MLQRDSGSPIFARCPPAALRWVRGRLVVEQKLKHRVGVDFWLLHIGNVGGVEHRDVGAGDVLTDEFVGFERGRGIVLAGDHERRGVDFRK